jgi:hypothetical protein
MKHRIQLDIVADFSHPDDARRAITRALVEQLRPPLTTTWFVLDMTSEPITTPVEQ